MIRKIEKNNIMHLFFSCISYLSYAPLQLWRRYETLDQGQGALTMIFFLVIFAGLALKLVNVGPAFWSFNPCPSLPSSATECRKQFQCLNIVLNNRTGLLLDFNLWGKGFTFFIKTPQIAWHSPYERTNHTIAKFPRSVCVLSKRLV